MAWFNSILGMNNPPSPNQYLNQMSTSTSTGTSLASAQPGSIVAVSNGGTGQNYWAAAHAQNTLQTMTHQNTMYVVMQYAYAIGWSVTYHHLPVGVTSDDPKIAILKITSVGEVLKDVGVRISDTDYYVMREPSE